MTIKANRKEWTREEETYLEESWGIVNRVTIAEKLGRSEGSIKSKSERMGLGNSIFHIDGITINQLAYATTIDYKTFVSWIERYEFPVKYKKLTANRIVKYVKYDDFWKWAEKNKHMIDFTKFDRLTLADEPDWVDAKRKADFKKKRYVTKGNSDPWSEYEINRLKYLVQKPDITYPKLSKELRRTHGSIKKKLSDLNIMLRPNYMNNHRKYTKDEVETLETMMLDGHSFVEIAFKLNRSEAGVRGKAERMGYTFKNGVPIKE